MSLEEVTNLEKQLLGTLKRIEAEQSRLEKNSEPVWKKPGWWVSWISLAAGIIAGSSFILSMVIERKFESWVDSHSPYVIEKKYAGGSGVIELANEAANLRRDVAMLNKKADRLLEDAGISPDTLAPKTKP